MFRIELVDGCPSRIVCDSPGELLAVLTASRPVPMPPMPNFMAAQMLDPARVGNGHVEPPALPAPVARSSAEILKPRERKPRGPRANSKAQAVRDWLAANNPPRTIRPFELHREILAAGIDLARSHVKPLLVEWLATKSDH